MQIREINNTAHADKLAHGLQQNRAPEPLLSVEQVLETLENMNVRLETYNEQAMQNPANEALQACLPYLPDMPHMPDAENTRFKTSQPVPEGYSGALLAELAEIERQEKAQCDFILERARCLAWQAVRNTPADLGCAAICLNWIKQARAWAQRRQHDALADTLDELQTCLQEGLPQLLA